MDSNHRTLKLVDPGVPAALFLASSVYLLEGHLAVWLAVMGTLAAAWLALRGVFRPKRAGFFFLFFASIVGLGLYSSAVIFERTDDFGQSAQSMWNGYRLMADAPLAFLSAVIVAIWRAVTELRSSSKPAS